MDAFILRLIRLITEKMKNYILENDKTLCFGYV